MERDRPMVDQVWNWELQAVCGFAFEVGRERAEVASCFADLAEEKGLKQFRAWLSSRQQAHRTYGAFSTTETLGHVLDEFDRRFPGLK